MQSDGSNVYPRIPADGMQNFVGRQVRIVGRVAERDTQSVTLLGHDNSRVRVETKAGMHITGAFAEFMGVVKAPGVLEESGFENFSENFDLKLSDEAHRVMASVYKH